MYQPNTVLLQFPCLLHAVAQYGGISVSLYLHGLYSHLSLHFLGLSHRLETVGLDDLNHLLDHVIVLLPFPHQGFLDLPLILHVDDIDHHLFRLEKAIDAVYRLNEIVELIINAKEDRPVAVPLEVAAASRQFFLGGKQTDIAVGEVNYPLLTDLVILTPVDIDSLRQCFPDRQALRLQIMPQDEMFIW